jgi:hypothetical protein
MQPLKLRQSANDLSSMEYNAWLHASRGCEVRLRQVL